MITFDHKSSQTLQICIQSLLGRRRNRIEGLAPKFTFAYFLVVENWRLTWTLFLQVFGESCQRVTFQRSIDLGLTWPELSQDKVTWKLQVSEFRRSSTQITPLIRWCRWCLPYFGGRCRAT